MIYLLTQTLLWLVLAFLLGLFLGWVLKGMFCSPCRSEESEATVSESKTEPEQLVSTDKPAFLDAPEGEADNLKRISGVGPVLEKTLNGLGIFHFRQIAALTESDIAWIDGYLNFPGRIEREGWIAQAAELAEGR